MSNVKISKVTDSNVESMVFGVVEILFKWTLKGEDGKEMKSHFKIIKIFSFSA